MYIRLKTNKISHCRALTRERIKKQTLLLFKVLRITLNSDQVYGEFTVDFLMSLLQMLLHSTCTPLFFIRGGLNIPPFFKRERGVEENMIVLCKEISQDSGNLHILCRYCCPFICRPLVNI